MNTAKSHFHGTQNPELAQTKMKLTWLASLTGFMVQPSSSICPVRMAALISHRCYETGALIGNPGGAIRKSCEGGASHTLRRRD